MYGWIWRHLPGPTPMRALSALVAVVSIVTLLLFVVFPAIDPHLPFSHPTVSEPVAPR